MVLRRWGEPVGCAAVAGLVFINTLPAGFVYDDNRAILENEDVRWSSPASSLMTHDFWGTPLRAAGSHGSWRPLTTLSFRLNHLAAGGLRAPHFHATNVLLHAAVTALFLTWARRVLPRGSAVPLLAALLFALHPVHCEAVAGLVGRAELAQTACSLLALLAYQHHCRARTRGWWMGVTVAMAAAAVLCKEQGMMTLAVCGACDLATHTPHLHTLHGLLRGDKLPPRLRVLRSRLRTLAAASLVLLMARLLVAGGTLPRFARADNPAAHEESLLTRTLTFLYLPAFNLALFLCPTSLSFDWSMDAVPLVRSWQDPRNLASLTLYAALGTLIYRCSRGRGMENRAALQGLTLSLLFYLPASNLVGYVGFVAAERVLYAPSLGPCLLLALGVGRLWRAAAAAATTAAARRRGVVLGALLLLLATLAARTVRRNRDWLTEETLYRSGLLLNPPKAYGNLGSVLASQGRAAEAERCYREALRHRPSMADVHYNLGLLLLQVGGAERLHEAETSLRAAISHRPKLAAAHVALGVALGRQGGRGAEAEAWLARAAALDGAGQRDPRAHQAARASAHLHLGRLLLERRQPREALEQLLRARDAMPPRYHQPQSVYSLLGEAYRRLGLADLAEPSVRAALEVSPRHVPAHLALARLLAANESRAAEAESWLHRALSLAPTDPAVLRGYGEFLLRRGQNQRAAELLQRVLEVTDEVRYQDLVNAATAQRLTGRLDLAERFYIQARDLRPQDAASHGNLGACQHLAGRLHEAERSYRKALDLQPEDQVTQENLNRLRRLLRAAGPT